MNRDLTQMSPEVEALYLQHIALPPDVPKNRVPQTILRYSFLWNRVLPLIGFPFVRLVDVSTEEHKVYRLEFVVCGIRTHYIHVTPFLAYTLGVVLTVAHRMFKHMPYVVLKPHPEEDPICIPTWAVKPLVQKLLKVVGDNEQYLDMIRDAIKHLAEKQPQEEPLITTPELLAEGKEPTIH